MFGHARMISAGLCSFFSHPVNMTLKNNNEYIKWSFSIGYCERYVNSKSDYLGLVLSVFTSDDKIVNKTNIFQNIQIISYMFQDMDSRKVNDLNLLLRFVSIHTRTLSSEVTKSGSWQLSFL